MDEQYLKIISAYMPVITAGLVAIFGAFIFYFQKSIERGIKYRDEIEKRYEAYMHSIFDVMAASTPENHAKFDKTRASLRLFAPVAVLEAAKIFEDHATRVKLVDDPDKAAGHLVLMMRRDVTPRRLFSRRLNLADMRRLNSFKLN